MLKEIGFWIENLDDQYQPPQFFVGGMDPADKEMVAAYLDRGVTYLVYRGFSWCRFGCGAGGTVMGNCDLTDGEWYWPSGLSHYLRCHDIRLPEEFITHVRQNRSRDFRRTTLDELLNECSHRNEKREEDDIWIRWCNEQVPDAIRERRNEAIIEAKREHLELMEEKFRKTEEEVGLSSQICLLQGCQHHALKDKFFCVRCIHKAGGREYSGQLAKKLYEFLDELNDKLLRSEKD